MNSQGGLLVLCCFIVICVSNSNNINNNNGWTAGCDGSLKPFVVGAVGGLPRLVCRRQGDDEGHRRPFYGYGAAWTQSTVINLEGLLRRNASAANLLLKVRYRRLSRLFQTHTQTTQMLFGSGTVLSPEVVAETGIPVSAGLSTLRIPLTATDFSVGDWTLEDVQGTLNTTRVQHIVSGLAMVAEIQPHIRFHAAPWTAPLYLKNSSSWGNGTLVAAKVADFVKLALRTVVAFKQQGIKIDWLSLQNEPLFQPQHYPGMFLPADMASEILPILSQLLGGATSVTAFDHNWDLVEYPIEMIKRLGCEAIESVSFHCYGGNVTQMRRVIEMCPRLEIHMTECSGGDWSKDYNANLRWQSEQLFLGSPVNGASSVLMWNLALNEDHGPTNGGCLDCRGVITIPTTATSLKDITFNVEARAMAALGATLTSSLQRPWWVHVPKQAPKPEEENGLCVIFGSSEGGNGGTSTNRVAAIYVAAPSTVELPDGSTINVPCGLTSVTFVAN